MYHTVLSKKKKMIDIGKKWVLSKKKEKCVFYRGNE